MPIPYEVERQLTKEHGKLITMFIERIVNEEIESEVLYFLSKIYTELSELFIEEHCIQVWIISKAFAKFIYNNNETLEVIRTADKCLWLRRSQGNLWSDSFVVAYAKSKASHL
jgi:hypothetical protein